MVDSGEVKDVKEISAAELVYNIYKELMEMSNEISSIKKLVELQGFQYTLLLSKLNELAKNQSPQKEVYQRPQMGGSVTSPDSPPIASIPTENIYGPAKDVTVHKVGRKEVKRDVRELTEDNFDEEVVTSAPVIDKHEEKFEEEEDNGNKVPITQLIYIPEDMKDGGKPITLASVEIKKENGKVVQKVKTNSVGRWQALLSPGKYFARVIRKYNDQIIDFEQMFQVDTSNKPIEVKPPDKYRRKNVQ